MVTLGWRETWLSLSPASVGLRLKPHTRLSTVQTRFVEPAVFDFIKIKLNNQLGVL